MTYGSVYNPVIGDIWEQNGYKVIPVNLQGVHGRGLAMQAKNKGLIAQHQNSRFSESNFTKEILTIAVKGRDPGSAKIRGAAWSEKVTGGNLNLMQEEIVEMLRWNKEDKAIWVPFLGLGFGEGDPDEILPILENMHRSTKNICMIAPDESVVLKYGNSFRPGVRKDSFALVQ